MTTAKTGNEQRVIITDKVSLDFSGLFESSKEASPTEPFLEDEPNKVPVGAENPLKGQINASEGQQANLQGEKYREDHQGAQEVYKEYQDNIKASFQLRTEILKGAKAGEDVCILFLKAAKAISLMTGDNLFYSQIEGDIKTVYGEQIAGD